MRKNQIGKLEQKPLRWPTVIIWKFSYQYHTETETWITKITNMIHMVHKL